MSHIIAMFDSGAGVEVMVTPAGSLLLNVYLPKTFFNATTGLMGTWTGHMEDDLQLPNGNIPLIANDNLLVKEIHDKFASVYRLAETKTKWLIQSLFWHDPVSYSYYDDRTFEPRFTIDQENMEEHKDALRVCSDSLVSLTCFHFNSPFTACFFPFLCSHVCTITLSQTISLTPNRQKNKKLLPP